MSEIKDTRLHEEFKLSMEKAAKPAGQPAYTATDESLYKSQPAEKPAEKITSSIKAPGLRG